MSGELTDEDLYDWLHTALSAIILQPRADDRRVRRQLGLMLRSFRPDPDPIGPDSRFAGGSGE